MQDKLEIKEFLSKYSKDELINVILDWVDNSEDA